MEQAVVELQTEALTVLEQAEAMPAVTTDAEYARVGQFIVDAKRLVAKIEAAHEPSINAAHLAHKAAIALRDSHIQPIKVALHMVEPLALDYKRQQDQKAREEAERIAKEKEAKALAMASLFEGLGDTEAAEAKLTEATATQRPTPLVSTLPKVAGMSTRKKWTFRIVNPTMVNRRYCQPSEALIKIAVEQAFYKISKVSPEMVLDLQDHIGGVAIFEDEIIVGRTK